MRRVVIEVGKPSKREQQPNPDEEEVSLEGITLHYHPKVRKMPLRYVKLVLEIKPVEEADPEAVKIITKLFGREPIKYLFDTYADIGKTDNVLDKEIKKKVRTIMLYDVLYKMR